MMNNFSHVTTIDDYINTQAIDQQTTRNNATLQLVTIFEQYETGIPIFEEVYSQYGFQQGPYHKRDVLGHTKETLVAYKKTIQYFTSIIPGLSKYLYGTIDELTLDTLIQLSLIYHDAGKKITKETTGYMRGHAAYTITHQWPLIATKYQLTPQEYEFTKILIEHHDTPPQNLPHAVTVILHTIGAYPAFLLMSLSDLMATQGPAIEQGRIDERRTFVQQELQKHFS